MCVVLGGGALHRLLLVAKCWCMIAQPRAQYTWEGRHMHCARAIKQHKCTHAHMHMVDISFVRKVYKCTAYNVCTAFVYCLCVPPHRLPVYRGSSTGSSSWHSPGPSWW
jgi:hypothetical protein